MPAGSLANNEIDQSMFKGTYTAIVTPFRNGKLDLPALEKLVKLQVRAGVDGIVPVDHRRIPDCEFRGAYRARAAHGPIRGRQSEGDGRDGS